MVELAHKQRLLFGNPLSSSWGIRDVLPIKFEVLTLDGDCHQIGTLTGSS